MYRTWTVDNKGSVSYWIVNRPKGYTALEPGRTLQEGCGGHEIKRTEEYREKTTVDWLQMAAEAVKS